MLVIGCVRRNALVAVRFATTPLAPPPDPTPRADPGGPVALTDDFGGRQLFPADNWWNQDISTAPVDPQSNAYIDFIGRTRGAHPDFGPPPYRHPVRRRRRHPGRACPVTFVDYGRRERRRLPRRERLSDSGRGEDAAELHRGRRRRAAGPSGDRHLLIVDRDRWVLFELFAARWNASRSVGSGLGRRLRPVVQRAAAGGLDVGRRRGPGDPARPGALRRGDARPDPPRVPRHRAQHERLRLARLAPRRQHGRRAADGRAAAPEGVEGSLTRYPAYIQNIFRAMQTYGLIVADNGSDMYVTGAMDARWNNAELNPAFASLDRRRFRSDPASGGGDYRASRGLFLLQQRVALVIQQLTFRSCRR